MSCLCYFCSDELASRSLEWAKEILKPEIHTRLYTDYKARRFDTLVITCGGQSY